VRCARLPGLGLELAFRELPEEREPLEQVIRGLEAVEEKAVQARSEWIENVAAPALARTPLLTGCPEEFLRAAAASLGEASFERGDIVTSVGETARSMLVVLEGAVELESKAGAKLGSLATDGILGEAEVLGLLTTRTVTARASSACRVLTLTEEALQRALQGPNANGMKEGLARLVANRQRQVLSGMPLCALSMGAGASDISVRAVNVQAEQLHLQPGQLWEPLPDTDVCGPHVGILVRGRAVVEMAADGREVMPLQPGSMLVEGLAAEFGAHVRLLSSDCEIYRLRRTELEAAARLAPPNGKVRSVTQEAADWFYQFRLLERDARARLQARLNSTRGLAATRVPHPCDPCIQDWSKRRQRSMRRAQQIRDEKADSLGGKLPGLQLPSLPSPGASKMASLGPGSCLPKSLAAYPVMRLPRISSEPLLCRSRSRKQAVVQRQCDKAQLSC